MGDGGERAYTHHATADGFTLIEIMVVIVLLSVIILGLMAMFEQVQKAFRAGMAQTDQMEGARMVNDQLQRDLEQITPSYQTNTVNFLSAIPNNYSPMLQALPATTFARTNFFDDLYFVSRMNQTWSGVGYFVRTNPGVGAFADAVGTLYRYQTNIPVEMFSTLPQAWYPSFLAATNAFVGASPISKILDGVVEFHIRCYDTNGVFLNQNSAINYPSNSVDILSWENSDSNEVRLYAFSNNIVPAYVEVELGVLEQATLKTYNSIPNSIARSNFLSAHAGNVQVFRQRIPIRNVDPTAY